MNRVCLVALDAIVRLHAAQPDSQNTALLRAPLLELARMADCFAPQCFFSECSLPLSAPEAPVEVDPSTATASSTDANRSPDKVRIHPLLIHISCILSPSTFHSYMRQRYAYDALPDYSFIQ